ncbi:MAG: Hsp20/alpha crystallin family protein [Candidatus Kerfeldbacteria bacterium]|nr:Hsp20/alpha crystallin family protein [Candidatus Kerfeldbacteria bacterium]
MALIKWTPMDVFGDLDRAWDDWPMAMRRVMSPALDVYEDQDNVVIETPLVGVDPKNVNIEIEDNILKISGHSQHQTEVDDKNYFRKEIRYGQFHRAVALPKAVAGDKAEATYKDGVLRITVPKTEEAKPRKITVKAQ